MLNQQASNFSKTQSENDKKKKESIVDLSKFIDKAIRIKFQGGREGNSSKVFKHLVLIFCVFSYWNTERL